MRTSSQPVQPGSPFGQKPLRKAFLAVAFAFAMSSGTNSHAGAPEPEPIEPDSNESPTPRDPASFDEPTAVSGDFRAQVDAPSPTQVDRAGPTIVLDPSARLLSGSAASESWTLYIDLQTGHRITQQFLLSNAGPGDHNAVAVGHLVEEGRPPYRYINGRRRARWKLSKDRLFFDIAASHLDLHRPTGELRITKDDIEIRLFFDFAETDFARSVPSQMLPKNYHVEVLAIAAATSGTIHAPWMKEPLETRGHTWLVHTWTPRSEAELLDRRIEFYGHENGASFYGIQVRKGGNFQQAWLLSRSSANDVIESSINITADWVEERAAKSHGKTLPYPVPRRFDFSQGPLSGQITLDREWLRFDPLSVLPQPFRWFIQRRSKPYQVWADARIGVSISPVSGTRFLPNRSEAKSDSSANRETEEETAQRSMTGVAFITFSNPSEDR